MRRYARDTIHRPGPHPLVAVLHRLCLACLDWDSLAPDTLTLSEGVCDTIGLHVLEVNIHHLIGDVLGTADELDNLCAAPV